MDFGGHHANADSIRFWHDGTESQDADYHNTYYWGAETVDNSYGPITGLIEAKDSSNGNALVDSMRYTLPADTENIDYDDDGNLKDDGLWVYTFNVRNQLTKMVSKCSVSQDNRYIEIKYIYDYLGRCSQKQVKKFDFDEGSQQRINESTAFTQTK